MASDRIKIRKKNNPSVTRTIMDTALKVFEKRGWESVSEESENASPLISTSVQTKKKDVVPVDAPGETDNADTLGGEPFTKVEDDSNEGSVDSLREEFLTLSGKAADKRWSEKRLNDEIAKLKTV
jgi:hypothetical protein